MVGRLGCRLASGVLLVLLACGCTGENDPPIFDAGADLHFEFDEGAPIDAFQDGPPVKAERIELTFVGDIIFGRYRRDGRFDPIVERSRLKPFAKLRPILASDVVVGNLETPVVEQLPRVSPVGMRYRFGGSRQMVRDYLGDFDVLGVANNHYFDLRADGQRESPRILSEEGVFPVGAARDEAQPFVVETYEAKGWRIGFVAVTTVVNALIRPHGPRVPQIDLRDMPAKLLPIIQAARADHDLIVVFVHWGDEYRDQPNLYQRQVAHKLVAGGANLVIGHHPHVLQGIERYGDGLIAYSLGNLLFEHNGLPRLMGILRTGWSVDVDRVHLTKAVFHPVVKRRTPYGHPEPARGVQARPMRNRIVALSRHLGTRWNRIKGSEDLKIDVDLHRDGRLSRWPSTPVHHGDRAQRKP